MISPFDLYKYIFSCSTIFFCIKYLLHSLIIFLERREGWDTEYGWKTYCRVSTYTIHSWPQYGVVGYRLICLDIQRYRYKKESSWSAVVEWSKVLTWLVRWERKAKYWFSRQQLTNWKRLEKQEFPFSASLSRLFSYTYFFFIPFSSSATRATVTIVLVSILSSPVHRLLSSLYQML